jgi:hypothetical protein
VNRGDVFEMKASPASQAVNPSCRADDFPLKVIGAEQRPRTDH